MVTDEPESVRTESVENSPMRVGLGQFMDPTEEKLRYIQQLGVSDVLVNMYQYDPDYPHMPDGEAMPLEGEAEWSCENLVALRERFENAGLRLNAIENVPISFYDDVMLGRDGRETQIEHLKNTIRNIGEAGIPMFGYHWMPSGVWRTGETTVRGGAIASAFDSDRAEGSYTHGREYTEEELWDNYEYFLRELLPVAEEADVNMCVHPNDPPVESLGGVPQLMRNFENFKRAMGLVPSDNHGLEFCLGCWSEMGADLEEVIRHFGSRGELFYVHFRDVEGVVPSFHETWVDEGNYDALEVMELLDEVDFSGMMIPDHTPHMSGDTDWDHRGRAFTVGYLRGLLRSIDDRNDGI
jgi:mannonate dehydratase